jgi:hypothetical protein
MLHEYINALDALPSFVDLRAVQLICQTQQLDPLVLHYFPSNIQQPNQTVWLEPQIGEPLPNLSDSQRLAIIMARPLARLLPERRGWTDAPLGFQWKGSVWLRRQMRGAGWRFSAEYRFHTLRSVVLNGMGHLCERFERPAQADRWQFAARQQYIAQPPAIATLSLLIYDHA